MSYMVKQSSPHPYLQKEYICDADKTAKIIADLNKGRGDSRGEHVKAVYYYEVLHDGEPMEGLKYAAKMILEHGTVKPWIQEGGTLFEKPPFYDENMAWIEDLVLISHNHEGGIEAGKITICYPLAFFDKSEKFPYSQLMMTVASEPFSAFTIYQAAKLIDLVLPKSLTDKLPPACWTNSRVRSYLGLFNDEPIIGTIVKPKAGLTPEIFAHSVVEAALAGARFTKADENMHLKMDEIQIYVGRVVKELESAGFWLGKGERGDKKGFLFAPHITTGIYDIMDYARLAVESGANALMFSPYYSGGFEVMAEISARFDVPVYAHTAGMNVYTGSGTWGVDSSIMYGFAARYGAAFMQLTAINGYLKPDDEEKEYILQKLQRDHLIGSDGMTLAIAGGVGPSNIGINAEILGYEGRMFLAGTSVYSHPDGASSGVKAVVSAYHAFSENGITSLDDLVNYAKSIGKEGEPLAAALKG